MVTEESKKQKVQSSFDKNAERKKWGIVKLLPQKVNSKNTIELTKIAKDL